jgi:hypothetical protein
MKVDVQAIRRKPGGPSLRPFDCENRMVVEIVIQARIRKLGSAQSIEVGMNEAEPSGIFMNQRERRAADFRRDSSEPSGDAADERRFTRP